MTRYDEDFGAKTKMMEKLMYNETVKFLNANVDILYRVSSDHDDRDAYAARHMCNFLLTTIVVFIRYNLSITRGVVIDTKKGCTTEEKEIVIRELRNLIKTETIVTVLAKITDETFNVDTFDARAVLGMIEHPNKDDYV